jgi:hypothetical protein
MNLKSVGAVGAGIVLIVVVTTIVDIDLHWAGVYPPLDQPINQVQAVIGTAYRVVIGIAGGWLTARLAPVGPMRHALILGGIGAALGLIGVVATWNMALGPRWYPIAHFVLAIPETWIGGKIFELRLLPGRTAQA